MIVFRPGAAKEKLTWYLNLLGQRILELNIVFLLSSRGAAVAISSPLYFSAHVLCFGQGPHQRDTVPLFLLRGARGNPLSVFDLTFVRG